MFTTIQPAKALKTTEERYDIRDLEILEKEKNYLEFLAHTNDIRPTERNDHWKDMVYNVSENFVDDLMARKQFSKETFQFLEKIGSRPNIRGNEIFQIKRGQYALSYLKKCFIISNKHKTVPRKDNTCFHDLDNFWNNTAKDFINLELGMKLAELTLDFYPDSDVWMFLSKVASSEFAAPYCKQEKLIGQLLKYLNKTSLPHNSDRLKDYLDKNISSACWNAMTPYLQKRLFPETKTNYKKLAFLMLQAKKSLPEKLKDTYLTLFMLNGPKIGPVFNEAWNIMKELGNDYRRREYVLSQLKNMQILPGKLFKGPDIKRLKIILEYFHQNFPEYLDYYGKTCINYLKGNSTQYNLGNPTPGCHELFRTSKNTNWLSSSLQAKYWESL